MPVFKYNNGTPMPDQITLVEGNKLTLKLDGLPSRGKAQHFIIKSSVAATVEVIRQDANPDRLEQKIFIAARATGPEATLRAYGPVDDAEALCKSVPDLSCVPTLRIKVVSRISLPELGTDEGKIAHLLLAEARSPVGGDEDDIRKSMQLMREVLDNRLYASSTTLGPLLNMVPKGATLADIIAAKGQFRGFEEVKSGVIEEQQQKTIDDFMKIANDGGDNRFKKVRQHVEYAIELAGQAAISPTEITKDTLTNFRTGETAPPSKNTVLVLELAGKQFFTLSPEYLKANLKK